MCVLLFWVCLWSIFNFLVQYLFSLFLSTCHRSEHVWKEGILIEEMSLQNWHLDKSVKPFLNYLLMLKCLHHYCWCHFQAEVPGVYKNAGRESHEKQVNKQHSSRASAQGPASMFPSWSSSLTYLNDREGAEHCTRKQTIFSFFSFAFGHGVLSQQKLS